MSNEPKMGRRGFLGGLLATAGLAGCQQVPSDGSAVSVSPTGIPSKELLGIDRFPLYVTQTTMDQRFGPNEKVTPINFETQRNTILIKATANQQDFADLAAEQGVQMFGPIEANNELGTAYRLTVNNNDYLLYQNDNVRGPEGVDGRCDATVVPLPCSERDGSFPSDREIINDTNQINAVLGNIAASKGKILTVIAYDSDNFRRECKPEPVRRDRDRNSESTPAGTYSEENPASTAEVGSQPDAPTMEF